MVEFKKLDITAFNTNSKTLKIDGDKGFETLDKALKEIKDTKGEQGIIVGNDDKYYVFKDKRLLKILQPQITSALLFVETTDPKTTETVVKANQSLLSSIYKGNKINEKATTENRENLFNQLMHNGIDAGEIEFISKLISDKGNITIKGREFLNFLAIKPEFQAFIEGVFSNSGQDVFDKYGLLSPEYTIILNSLADTPKGKEFILSLVTLPQNGFINANGEWTDSGVRFARNLLKTGSGSEIIAQLLTSPYKYDFNPYIDNVGELTRSGMNLMQSLSTSDRFDNKMVLTKILSGQNGAKLFQKLLTQKDSIYVDTNGNLNDVGKGVVKTLGTLSSEKYSGISTLRWIASNSNLPAEEKEFINNTIDAELTTRFLTAFPKIQDKNKYQSGYISKGQRDLGYQGQTDCFDCACDVATAFGKGKTNRPDELYYKSELIARYKYKYDPKNPDKLDENFVKQLKIGDVIRVMPDQHWAIYIGEGLVSHGNWAPKGTDYVVENNALVVRDRKTNPQRRGEPVITSINEITRFGDRRNITVYRLPY